MFAFGSSFKVPGSADRPVHEQFEFNFVKSSEGRVYTYTDEDDARKAFNLVKHHAHLYLVNPDLSTAALIESGDCDRRGLVGPPQVSLTEDQQRALYDSFPFKSLLQWSPQ